MRRQNARKRHRMRTRRVLWEGSWTGDMAYDLGEFYVSREVFERFMEIARSGKI